LLRTATRIEHKSRAWPPEQVWPAQPEHRNWLAGDAVLIAPVSTGIPC